MSFRDPHGFSGTLSGSGTDKTVLVRTVSTTSFVMVRGNMPMYVYTHAYTLVYTHV